MKDRHRVTEIDGKRETKTERQKQRDSQLQKQAADQNYNEWDSQSQKSRQWTRNIMSGIARVRKAGSRSKRKYMR